ncbi:MAG: aminopeptidase, partial [Bacteroidota bacterium]|nr:aminopeptidase [Bacteroidota bacterium]
MELLKQLCQIPAPSGNEVKLTQFLLNYIDQNKSSWRVTPQVIAGEGFQDCIILVFGQPRTAIFAHIDSIGFTVRYGRELIRIGGPDTETGYRLVGEDSQGPISCTLQVYDEDNSLSYEFEREIERGTELLFACDFRETETTVQSCYLDNRLGVWNALQVAKTLENGAIVFSCWEEHRGGSVAYLARYLHENYKIKQALISDITWVTEGVHPGQGVVISMRDSLIPRRSFVNKLIALAKKAEIPFQLEVEG